MKQVLILNTIAAIVALSTLSAYALSLGVDGALYGFVILIIAGLGGFNAKELMNYLPKP